MSNPQRDVRATSPYADADRAWKNMEVSKGRGRFLLLKMAERIELEPEFTEDEIKAGAKHPLPKNPIERGLYQFLKNCATGDKDYIKELLDRLDGRAAQQIKLTDENDDPLGVQIIRYSDLPLVGASSAANTTPKRLDS
jgi:hypothetical protein